MQKGRNSVKQLVGQYLVVLAPRQASHCQEGLLVLEYCTGRRLGKECVVLTASHHNCVSMLV